LRLEPFIYLVPFAYSTVASDEGDSDGMKTDRRFLIASTEALNKHKEARHETNVTCRLSFSDSRFFVPFAGGI
jgi:hypothetical protein